MKTKQKHPLITALLAIASLLLIVALLFTCLQICMNQRNWYYESYVKYGTADDTLISDEDMTRAIWRLIDYMEKREDSIQLSVVENGAEVEMYNQQEIDHMVDVRALYQFWRAVRDFSVLSFVLVALGTLSCLPKGDGERLRVICTGFLWGCCIFGAALAALGIWVAVDFSSFWTGFHHLFFTNDLWLMDYATCRMIRICPLQLFNDIVVRFALLFMIPFFALTGIAIWGHRRRAK